VEGCTSVCAEADGIAGVWGNAWLVENNMGK